MLHETGTKGDIGVAMVTADLLKQEYIVLTPVSSASPFDLVSYKGGDFKKIQVKYRHMKDDKVEGQARRAVVARGKIKPRMMTDEEFDVMAFYCPETDECYYVPKEQMNGMTVTLRFKPAKNGQEQGIKLASDFRRMI